MTRFLLFPVFFPMLAGLFAYFLGRWQEKARDMFILSASAMELLLVLVIWTNPELAHTTAEVAAILGKKEATVRTWLFRARGLLRDMLCEEESYER